MNDFNPKYQEIINSIKEKIQTNLYINNRPLPSESALCTEYNASRITVRKAISVLLSEGYIYSIQGKGNYVKKMKRNRFAFHYSYKTIFKNGYDEAKLISSNLIKPDVYLVYNLNIAPEEKVVALEWVIYENNRPIAYDAKYLAYFSGINISEKSLRYQDFSDLVKNRISCYEINQKIQIKGVKADEVIAKRLKIKTGDVLMMVEIKVSDQNNLPFGWGKLYVLPEKVTFMAHSVEK